MYAKLCQLEILSSYIKQVSVGDVLTVEALITNPLDWHHFYEKISVIRKGEKTDFTVVTNEGDRVIGMGDIVEVDKWSNYGHYGFKIKINVKKQKSLTEKKVREIAKLPEPRPANVQYYSRTQKVEQLSPEPLAVSAIVITQKDIASFGAMLKNSVALDMA